jgi:putative heme degradation protein
MTDEIALRQQMTAAPDRVLARLPAMGKVMVVVQDGGVTHERIGAVEKIGKSDDGIVVTGAAHDCLLDPAHIASVVVDRSGRMKDKVLPKLEFIDADGRLVFSVVGLDGIEKFDEALSRFAGVPVKAKAKPPGEQATLPKDDPALQPFVAANNAETEIAIDMEKPGMLQRWRGLVPAVNPAMGFINIIASDFHLHIRGGAVTRWQQHAEQGGRVRLVALDADGRSIGLTLRGPQGAFEAA